MVYRIIRPDGARKFFAGFALEVDESIYVDDGTVAAHFMLRGGWLVDEVEEAPKDYRPPACVLDKEGKPPEWMKDGIIRAVKCSSLRNLLREDIVHLEESPKGSWEIYGKPSDWTTPFFYGYDTRKLPFKVGNYQTVQRFAERGFAVRDARSKRPIQIAGHNANLMGGIQPEAGRVMVTTDFDKGGSDI